MTNCSDFSVCNFISSDEEEEDNDALLYRVQNGSDFSVYNSISSDEEEEDNDALLYLPVSPEIDEPEESAWQLPPDVVSV